MADVVVLLLRVYAGSMLGAERDVMQCVEAVARAMAVLVVVVKVVSVKVVSVKAVSHVVPCPTARKFA